MYNQIKKCVFLNQQKINLILKATEPFISYIYVKPEWKQIFNNKWNSTVNPYGHTTVRYCIPGKMDRIMNISGSVPDELVFFFDPEEYIFTKTNLIGDNQGSISERSFIELRINGNEEKVIKLNQYYEKIKIEALEKKIEFSPLPWSFYDKLFENSSDFFKNPIKGNCCYWSTSGFKEIGLIDENSSWPLHAYFKIIKNHIDNINIISYKGINSNIEPIKLLVRLFHRFQFDLDDFSNIIIEPKLINEDENNQFYELNVIHREHIKTKIDNFKEYFN